MQLSSPITYEQPLNERIRTFLRVEHLFDLVEHYAGSDSSWDARLCLATMLEIVDLGGRSDIKAELGKELERHAVTLTALQKNPGVDQSRLSTILEDINAFLANLRNGSAQPGQVMRKDELIQSIKQRNAIPGGTCNFDLPAYHHWLAKPAAERHSQVGQWKSDLLVLREGLNIALGLIRSSTSPTQEQAERGFFQKPIEAGAPCHMVRVVLPADSPYYPEISGGKHRFTVRFMEQPDTRERPVQTGNAVDFILHCCTL